MKRQRQYSRETIEAAQLLGAQVALSRRERRWSARDLAERAGITQPTLRKVERGDPTVGLGVAFEVATLVGVPLFHEDQTRLSLDLDRTRSRVAVLPRRVRMPADGTHDDF
jgi:transcriptional regulator with XRE-family HTH domain